MGGPPPVVYALESIEILSMGMLWTTLPVLLRSDEYPGQYGVVTGVASAIGLATGAVGGRLSDVHGRTLVLLLAVGLFALSHLLLGAASLPALQRWGGVPTQALMVGGALLGRCSTTSGALRKALVADLSEPSGRTAALGRLAAMGGAGFVVGPTLAGRLVDLDVTYAVYAQTALASVAVSLAVTIWRRSVDTAPTKPDAKLEPAAASSEGDGWMSTVLGPVELLHIPA